MVCVLSCSDATALGGTAAVVRRRRDVLDGTDLEARGLEGTDGCLTTGAWALDEDVDLLHAVLLGAAGSGLSRHLRGVRRALARALEADVAGGGPRDHVALRVGDRDDRVVERALDVSVAVGHVLLLLAAHLLGACGTALGRHALSILRGSAGGRHFLPTFFLPAMARRGPLRVRALVCVR